MQEVHLMSNLFESLKANLSFVAVCALIVVALVVIAKLAEHYLPQTRKVSPARRITIIAMSAAIAAVLHMLDFPLPFLAPTFYKVDFSELSVLLCGFYLGPAAGVITEGLKIVIKLLFKSTSTAFVGDLANFVVGCALVLPATIIYHTGKTQKRAVLGLVVGTLCMSIFGSAFNAVYLLPKFAQLYGMPLDVIIGMGSEINAGIKDVSSFAMLAVAPLNVLKGGVVSLLTMLLYKRVARPIFGKLS